jgi:hypothetical protein
MTKHAPERGSVTRSIHEMTSHRIRRIAFATKMEIPINKDLE